MSLINSTAIPSAAAAYTIANSLRFEDGSSAYLNRTISSNSNRKTFTLSLWAKRGNMITSAQLLGARSGLTFTLFYFSNNRLNLYDYAGGSEYQATTSATFTNPSIWYHVVLAVDTTQGTQSNRVKIYVNGTLQGMSTNNFPQNFDMQINSTLSGGHQIGRQSTGSDHYDGLLAEMHLVDGQQLTAADFGETVDSEWKPIEYSGSYGTNGFYLDFADSGALGDDESGNTNDWTVNNMAASDQLVASPNVNFCTLDPTDTAGSETWHEGNLKWYSSGSNAGIGRSTTQGDVSSGKWYWEFLAGAGSRAPSLGIVLASEALSSSSYYVGQTSGGYGMFFNGYKYTNGGSSAYGASFGNGDIIGIALDMDNTSITFYKNGSSQGVAWSNISAGAYSPAMGSDQTGRDTTVYANFGRDSSFSGQKTAQGNQDGNGIGDFYYTPPSGYLALCSANQ